MEHLRSKGFSLLKGRFSIEDTEDLIQDTFLTLAANGLKESQFISILLKKASNLKKSNSKRASRRHIAPEVLYNAYN